VKLDSKLLKRIAVSVFVAIVVLVIMSYKYHFYYFFLRLITPRTNKAENNEKISELHPVFAYKVGRFINELERNGSNVTITSGFRSFEKQSELYNSGITPAPPGSSFHNYGQAVDINVDNLVQASSVQAWSPVAELAKNKYGFRWGGDFQGNWDKVHFDNGNFYKMEQLKKLYNENEIVNNKYVKIF